MNSYFQSYLQYKALSSRFNNPSNGMPVDQVLELFLTHAMTGPDGKPVDDAVINESLRLQNVCAKISIQLVRRMEATLNVLSMTKREFIEIAIITALEESERIMAENEVPIPEYKEDDLEEEV